MEHLLGERRSDGLHTTDSSRGGGGVEKITHRLTHAIDVSRLHVVDIFWIYIAIDVVWRLAVPDVYQLGRTCSDHITARGAGVSSANAQFALGTPSRDSIAREFKFRFGSQLGLGLRSKFEKIYDCVHFFCESRSPTCAPTKICLK